MQCISQPESGNQPGAAGTTAAAAAAIAALQSITKPLAGAAAAAPVASATTTASGANASAPSVRGAGENGGSVASIGVGKDGDMGASRAESGAMRQDSAVSKGDAASGATAGGPGDAHRQYSNQPGDGADMPVCGVRAGVADVPSESLVPARVGITGVIACNYCTIRYDGWLLSRREVFSLPFSTSSKDTLAGF